MKHEIIIKFPPRVTRSEPGSDGATVGELDDDGVHPDDGSDGSQEEFNHDSRPRQ